MRRSSIYYRKTAKYIASLNKVWLTSQTPILPQPKHRNLIMRQYSDLAIIAIPVIVNAVRVIEI